MWGSFVTASHSGKGKTGEAWAKIMLVVMPLLFLPMLLGISWSFYSNFKQMGLTVSSCLCVYCRVGFCFLYGVFYRDFFYRWR